MTDEIPIGAAKQLAEQRQSVHQVGDAIVAVFFHEGSYFAVEDRCPHRAGPLSEGVLFSSEEGSVKVVCPWHGSEFELQSGDILKGPARRCLKTFPVGVRDGQVFVGMPDAQAGISTN